MSIRIGELAKQTQCSVEAIRYYERVGLLPPPDRSDGNYRLYGKNHIDRLMFIRHCRALDMALEDVRVLLQYRDNPAQDCGRVNALLDHQIEAVAHRLDELGRLKEHLVALRGNCEHAAAAESCGILRALSLNDRAEPAEQP